MIVLALVVLQILAISKLERKTGSCDGGMTGR